MEFVKELRARVQRNVEGLVDPQQNCEQTAEQFIDDIPLPLNPEEVAALEQQCSVATDAYLAVHDAAVPHDTNIATHLRPLALGMVQQALPAPDLQLSNAVRAEAFLMAVALALPRAPAPARAAAPGGGGGGGGGGGACYPQLERAELLLRLRLWRRALALLAARAGDPRADAAADAARAAVLRRSYAAAAARAVAPGGGGGGGGKGAAAAAAPRRPARLLLPPLLYALACETLAVRLPAPEVRAKVAALVASYEKNARLWAYHPASQSADRYLRPLVEDFLAWLRAHRARVLHAAATEGLLASLDPALRRALRAQVYRSPEHFLKVFNSVAPRLSWIPLPSYALGDAEVDGGLAQALRDVAREAVLLDGRAVPGRQAQYLLRQRFETLLKRGTVLKRIKSADVQRKVETEKLAPRRSESVTLGVRRDSRKTSDGVLGGFFSSAFSGSSTRRESATSDDGVEAENQLLPGGALAPQPEKKFKVLEEVTVLGIEEGEGLESDNEMEKRAEQQAGEASQESTAAAGPAAAAAGPAAEAALAAEVAFHRAVDALLYRVLRAASRTRAGGDSFFVAQDLFGGDGVLLKPSEYQGDPISIDIEDEFIIVKSTSTYDVYNEEEIATAEEQVYPLMTIQTLMTEILPPSLGPTPPPFNTAPTSQPASKKATIKKKSSKTRQEIASVEEVEEEDDSIEEKLDHTTDGHMMQSPPSSLAVLTDIQARRSGRYLTIRASRPLACPPPLVTADAAAAGFASPRVVEGHYCGEPQTSISEGRVLPGQVEQRTVLGGGDVVPVLAKKTTKNDNSDDAIMKKKQKDVSSTVLGRKEKAKPSTIFQLFHSAIANSKGGNRRGEPIHNKQPALLPPEQEQIMRDQPKQHTTAEIKISPMQQAASTKEAEEDGYGEEYSYYGNSSSNPFAAASAMFEDLDLF